MAIDPLDPSRGSAAMMCGGITERKASQGLAESETKHSIEEELKDIDATGNKITYSKSRHRIDRISQDSGRGSSVEGDETDKASQELLEEIRDDTEDDEQDSIASTDMTDKEEASNGESRVESDSEPGVEGDKMKAIAEGGEMDHSLEAGCEEVDGLEGYPENNGTRILHKYMPKLADFIKGQDMLSVANEFLSRSLITSGVHGLALEMNGSSDYLKVSRMFHQLGTKISRTPDTLIQCIEALENCLPVIEDLTQDMLKEYNESQSETIPNGFPELSDVPGSAYVPSNELTETVQNHKGAGINVDSQPQSFLDKGELRVKSVRRLAKEMIGISEEAHRELVVTQEQAQEFKQRADESAERIVVLECENEVLKDHLADSERKKNLLNRKVVEYEIQMAKYQREILELKKLKDNSKQKEECEEKDKEISRLKEQCKDYQAEIGTLNERNKILVNWKCACTCTSVCDVDVS